MNSADNDIQNLFDRGELSDSEQRILVYLERFDVGDFPLQKKKKQLLPNASKISSETGLAVTTTSQSLLRLNNKGLIVYSRLGMQKKAVLTKKGLSIVAFIKKMNLAYYKELKKLEK